jgi:hypothetical protein
MTKPTTKLTLSIAHEPAPRRNVPLLAHRRRSYRAGAGPARFAPVGVQLTAEQREAWASEGHGHKPWAEDRSCRACGLHICSCKRVAHAPKPAAEAPLRTCSHCGTLPPYNREHYFACRFGGTVSVAAPAAKPAAEALAPGDLARLVKYETNMGHRLKPGGVYRVRGVEEGYVFLGHPCGVCVVDAPGLCGGWDAVRFERVANSAHRPCCTTAEGEPHEYGCATHGRARALEYKIATVLESDAHRALRERAERAANEHVPVTPAYERNVPPPGHMVQRLTAYKTTMAPSAQDGRIVERAMRPTPPAGWGGHEGYFCWAWVITPGVYCARVLFTKGGPLGVREGDASNQGTHFENPYAACLHALGCDVEEDWDHDGWHVNKPGDCMRWYGDAALPALVERRTAERSR